MSIGGRLRDALGSLLRSRGYEIVESKLLYEWQKHPPRPPPPSTQNLTADAIRHLEPKNPELIELQRRYALCDKSVTTPLVWNETLIGAADLPHFRGENAYVWQLRGLSRSPLAYALSAYYVRANDELRLLERLSEDGTFGAACFEVGGHAVSRDLLDSIVELYFLERHLKLSTRPGLRILDIGAGYGRLAHRATTAFANIEQYLCTDAVAVSSFLCRYYLQQRALGPRARVVPLDEIEGVLGAGRIDLAINVHSFSECRPAAIDWWLSRLAAARVEHLMIVPTASEAHDGSRLRTNDGIEFGPMVKAHGYRPVAVDPKYLDPIVQRYGLDPSFHHLFRLA